MRLSLGRRPTGDSPTAVTARPEPHVGRIDGAVEKQPDGDTPRYGTSGCVRGLAASARTGSGVAAQEIGERHPQRVVLHLPDVAELVRDQVVVGEERARAQEDRPVQRRSRRSGGTTAAGRASGDDPDPDAAKRDRPRVELEPVEPLLRAVERLTLRRAPRADAIASARREASTPPPARPRRPDRAGVPRLRAARLAAPGPACGGRRAAAAAAPPDGARRRAPPTRTGSCAAAARRTTRSPRTCRSTRARVRARLRLRLRPRDALLERLRGRGQRQRREREGDRVVPRRTCRSRRFERNALAPPLAFDDESFDLVYALSVFTHLTAELQLAWRDELLPRAPARRAAAR